MKQWSIFLLTVLSGAAAGFVNGFFGTGGGIILLGALAFLDTKSSCLKENGVRRRFALTLAVTGAVSVVSLFSYAVAGNIPLDICLTVAVPAVIGGFVGGKLIHRLGENVLKIIFSALVIWAGIMMI